MNEFVFHFVRIVWIGALITALLLMALGGILLLCPALLVGALRFAAAPLCIAAAVFLLIRLFL